MKIQNMYILNYLNGFFAMAIPISSRIRFASSLLNRTSASRSNTLESRAPLIIKCTKINIFRDRHFLSCIIYRLLDPNLNLLDVFPARSAIPSESVSFTSRSCSFHIEIFFESLWFSISVK